MFKRFVDTIKEMLGAIAFNLKATVLFLLIYTLLASSISWFITYGFFRLGLLFSGIKYLGNDTIKAFLTMPLNWLMLIVWFFIMGAILLMETGGFVAIFQSSLEKKKMTLGEAISWGLNAGRRAISFKNIGLIFYLLLLLPFLGIIQLSCGGMSIKIPGFIMDVIYTNKLMTVGFVILILALLFIAVKWCFSIHSFVIEKKNFNEAAKESITLTKKHWFKTFFSVVLGNLFIVLCAAALFGIVSLIIAAVLYFSPAGFSGYEFLDCGYYALLIITYLFVCLLPIFNQSLLTTMNRRRRESVGLPEIKIEEKKALKKPHLIIILVLCIVCAVGITAEWAAGTINRGLILTRPDVGAHRGDSVRAPENTMPAFKLAIEEGAEWIELDVHQTSDGVIVVTHDDNLERISGVDKCVHELTYAEIQELEIGSWFSEEYRGLRVSTLDEVLEVCKDKVKVQIELKPTEYDKDLEKSVIDIIKARQMEYQCVIISMDSQALINTKKIAPNIITVYTMVISNGDVEFIEYADWYSIEESNVTIDLVERMHNMGKACIVWTINDAESVQPLIDAGVDCIVGDDPVMLNETLDESRYDGGLGFALRSLFNK